MGISLNKNSAFTITDNLGSTKFSLNSKMPHIIHESTGNVAVPGLSLSIGQQTLTRVDTLVTLADTYISTDNSNNFIFPFISIKCSGHQTSLSSLIRAKVKRITQKKQEFKNILNNTQKYTNHSRNTIKNRNRDKNTL